MEIDNSELFQPGVCCYSSVSSLNQYMGEDQLLIYYMRVNVLDKSQNPQQNPLISKKNRPKPGQHPHNKGLEKPSQHKKK